MALTATGEQVAWHDPGAAEEDKCCCGGGGCCLYPWPDPEGTPLYPDSDLPDSILINGVSFAKTGSYEYNNGVDTVLTYGGSVTGLWNLFHDGFYYASECLISDLWTAVDGGTESFTVEDEFPDTLYFHQDDAVVATAEIPRESLCCASGTLTYTNEFDEEVNIPLLFCYMTESPGEVFPAWPDKPCWVLDYGATGTGPFYAKEDPQSSPEGDYSPARDRSMIVDTTP